jgi:hypothetical protein
VSPEPPSIPRHERQREKALEGYSSFRQFTVTVEDEMVTLPPK